MTRRRVNESLAVTLGAVLLVAMAAASGCRQRQVGLAVSGALQVSPEDATLPAAPGPERLRAFLEATGADAEVRRFYEQRDHAPAWFEGWQPRAALTASLDVLRAAQRHGIELTVEADGLADRLEQVVAGDPPPSRALLEVEAGVTRALLEYATVQLEGRVHPDEVDVEWHLPTRGGDAAAWVGGLATADDPQAELASLTPPHAGYDELMEALARYRELVRQGGWDEVPDGAVLRPGDEAPVDRLAALARRLGAEGYPAPQIAGFASGTAVYGAELEQALRAFQERHGIAVDGVLGPNTLRELNVTAGERVEQIRLNLDRWRWLPAELGDPRIVVNVPAFQLRVVEDGREAMAMRVVVGREGWGTPFFSERLDLVVMNPFWNVPDSIARAEIIPRLAEDPGYAERNRYAVLSSWSSDAAEVDPYAVDWAGEGSSYRFRRSPGPSNPLGRVKFLFTGSPFSIYLHDTPGDHVFDRADRAASHGCVRVERPLELADWVLDGWDRGRVERAIASGRNQYVKVDDPVAVHLVYFTAEVRDGQVYFFPDIYAVDAAHARALDRS